MSLLVIGTSTGGPNALGTLWPMLTAPCPVPVLLVQHMPPKFTKSLADRLSGFGTVPIAEAVDGEPLRSGRGYIAPGDHHMRLRRTTSGITLRLDHGPLENSCRPSLEPTFRSAAEYFGAGVLAVMLTGMGQDGIEGSAAIVEAGGTLIAQDKESSVVWGMPGAVVSAGLTDLVLPLDQIAPAINRRLQAAVPSVANRPYRPLVARGTS